MDLGPVVASSALAPAPPPPPGGRPAQSTAKTQPGENPSVQGQGVVRSESAQPDQAEVGQRQDVRDRSARNAELSRAEQQVLDQLQARDREVRSHEAAHRRAGGSLVRGGSYSYERGPDNRLYAIGGEVQIDTSPVPGDPQATLQKAEQIRRAALAPIDPSPQDRSVAAQAAIMANQARAEIRSESVQSAREGEPGENNDDQSEARAEASAEVNGTGAAQYATAATPDEPTAGDQLDLVV